jgi:hypothetical protein
MASSPDLEAHELGARPARPRKPRLSLFLMLAAVSLVWLFTIVWTMHGMHGTEHDLAPNVDFEGGDIDSVADVATVTACQLACESHPRCLAFTYVKSQKLCWRKGEGVLPRGNHDTTSGTINATLAATRRGALQQRKETNWRSNEATDELADEAADEAADEGKPWLAQDFDEAVDDGFNRNENSFWGEEEGEEIGMGEDGSMLPTAAATDDSLHNESTSFFGDIHLELDVTDASTCESFCLDSSPRCEAWTLDYSHSVCMLRRPGAPRTKYNGDFVSGVNRAADQGVNGTGVARLAAPLPLDNTDLRGGDLSLAYDVDTAERCHEECAAAEGCVGWTLSKAHNVCYLKTANHTVVHVSRSAGFISGLLAK